MHHQGGEQLLGPSTELWDPGGQPRGPLSHETLTVHRAQLARLLPVIHFFSRVLVFEEGRCVQVLLSMMEHVNIFLNR